MISALERPISGLERLLPTRMVDKVLSGGRPRQKYAVESDAAQPLLPLQAPDSHPPKGSPGENAMRGVRKLSICNIPQAKRL